MLTINGVEIYAQNLGTVMGIFLKSKDKEAIEQRYFSLWNHGATGGELDWWSEECGLIWLYNDKHRTAEEKLFSGFVQANLAILLNKGGTKRTNPLPRAIELANQQLDSIEFVTWVQSRVSVNLYGMGDSVNAEKGTGNFNDDVLGGAVSGTLSSERSELIKSTENEEYEEEEKGSN